MTLRQTFLETLDPRTKLVALLLLTATILTTKSILSLSFASAILWAAVLSSSISFSQMVKKLTRVVWFVLFILVIQMVTTSGEVVFSSGSFVATREGMREGIVLSLKVVLLFVCSTLFVAATPIQEMLDAVETVTHRFKTSGSLFLLVSITLNFLPLLIRSTQHMKTAQIARGADIDSSLFKQLRFASSAALPLFVSSFRASHQLADAMEARGFDPRKARTPFRELKLQERDWLLLIGVTIACVTLFFGEHFINS